ncbi:AAA domain [Trypanosoma vivax]|uniref:ATP-dependent DNA helicase n=1 Tax=Trypanosoma vivax (strain Y486) TaxID=1055687 RepID=G0UD87_TRYVY|nr:putative DNA repair and recombination protein,mitochondrial precursor [Trypanosoma vivax]KAH8609099.1 AAA domain [Trypanosoma vivax]CCC53798.1 putative DNA repair and recombination protein,mitochondrial precursor [Trypanosoma vivax Y486]
MPLLGRAMRRVGPKTTSVMNRKVAPPPVAPDTLQGPLLPPQQKIRATQPTSQVSFKNMVENMEDDGRGAFVNPFTARLTQPSSRVARELLHAGFEQCPMNPFRLVWAPKSSSALAAASLRPFRNSPVAWRKKLAALLEREDAAQVVNAEIQRLYGELTGSHLPPKLGAAHDPQIGMMKMTPDQENAIRCALQGYSMFVGGSAGTGKTVLLKTIHSRLTDAGLRVAVTATTGVAAVQLGGCTFHMAFGVPIRGERLGKRKWDLNALRAIDVVIIDEVSLLDAELFDAFESEARMARLQTAPFGGLQVIVCGDFLQLATADTETTGPCFESAAFRNLITLRLVTPMRQKEGDPFYEMLSQLRVGIFNSMAFGLLDRPLPTDVDNITYIFPRRADAQRLNEEKLSQLQSEEMTFAPQPGPLQLIGSFTQAALIDLSHSTDQPTREDIVLALIEEFEKLAGISVLEHNVVVMPVRTGKGSYLLRLRHTDECMTTKKSTCDNTRKDHPSSGGSVTTSMWQRVLEATTTRMGAVLCQVYREDPSDLVPPSVSMMLADACMHPTNDFLTPLRLKVGCRVMVNRNLSRTVSNGSVGVVEAFAEPRMDLFPRRYDHAQKTAYGRQPEGSVFPKLPIVRLLNGELVQLPPFTLTVGGTPSTFFYGHALYLLPLQLGYGFTVHKVQGLTLQGTVVLDCEKFFDCPHLIYVACSRVRSMDQLIVKNVHSSMVTVNRNALQFSNALMDASNAANIVPPEGCVPASWAQQLEPSRTGLPQ